MDDAATAKHRLEGVLSALAAQGEERPPPPLETFARRLLARASGEYLESRSADWVAGEVRASYELLASTPPGEIAARVRELPDAPGRFAVNTAMPDRAFIVDTLREYLHAEGYSIAQLLHPVIEVVRDEEGRPAAIDGRAGTGDRTSVTYVLAEGQPGEDERRALEEGIRGRLDKVRQATSDFEPMLERCRELIGDLRATEERLPWRKAELREIQDFLEWLTEGRFVFLGYRAYHLRAGDDGGRRVSVRRGSGLGILRDEERSRYWEPMPVSELSPEIQARLLGGPLFIFSKSNAESPVHRHARMDYIGVKEVADEGRVLGERRFLGLLTSRAYSQDASEIPRLRRKLREILEVEDAPKGSHDYHLIHRIFNSMPKEELFTSSVPELLHAIDTIMETEGAAEVRVTARPDALGRGVNVMVILPATKFSAGIRRKIQEELVRSYRGEVLNYHLALGGGDQARLHFYLSSGLEDVDQVDVEELEERVRQSARSWSERLADALERAHGPERGGELLERHRGEFSSEYTTETDVETAVEDIGHLEALEETGLQQVVTKDLEEGRSGGFRLKVFAPRGLFVLSDVMPTLENLGLRVLEADKYEVARGTRRAASLHTFDVLPPSRWEVDLRDAEARVEEVLRAVRRGETEDDRLNSLVLSAGLGCRQVAVLRAYANYAFRIGAVTSRVGVRRPLTEHPRSARLLYRIFRGLHDPAEQGEDAAGRVEELKARFEETLEEVRGIDDDRAFRQLLHLVEATVRTNVFQDRVRERDSGMVALKFDCDRIEFAPRPRPKYEVYVNSADTEGVHLRMAPVARGGVRWSDRTEDFRVEVLGLAKTQQVKNAVIVPAGAKGGYVVKDLPDDPEDRRRVADESYEQFVRGLLDVCDNVVDEAVRPPPQTVVRDGDDPYLVVAPDKGTAHLSDTANELAARYDFWLGDAFASGGSQGYDHKKLGITARGVWECVERHFREMGRNVREETFTVVGIGDMSGDVFGNGMLLNRNIRLVAAFDHRHVFLDPDPDPEASWAERKRLFEAEGSTWADYDEAAISEGGGVYDRGAKQIRLSPAVQRRLEVDAEALNGEALISAILRAPVDLLWNGGVGTYVKAESEADAAVEDPANDACRVDGREVRARVVGEGGNLGFTQRARVEYALNGGRLNTDALDNSAGVDMSDHEVNLKILLNPVLRDGEMSRERRTALLHDVEEVVAAEVLRDNYLQSLAVSLERRRSREVPAEFRDALTFLEREGDLDRQVADLPTTEQILERQEEGEFLTRPELSVLLAHGKLDLKRRIQSSGLPGDEALDRLLLDYFPDRVVDAVGERRVLDHRLRREIVATSLANAFVNRMGVAGHVQLARETGQSFPEIARAWYAVFRVGDARSLYRKVEETDYRVPAGVQHQWYLQVGESLERGTRWLLSNEEGELGLAELVDRFSDPVRRLRSALPNLLPRRRREELRNEISLHETDGADPELAEELATFGYLDALLPVAQLARDGEVAVEQVGRIYFGLTGEIDFAWLQEELSRAPGADLWEQRAAKALSLQLESARTRLCSLVLAELREAEDVPSAMGRFRDRHAGDLRRIREVVRDVRSEERPSIAALMVAVNAIRAQARSHGG